MSQVRRHTQTPLPREFTDAQNIARIFVSAHTRPCTNTRKDSHALTYSHTPTYAHIRTDAHARIRSHSFRQPIIIYIFSMLILAYFNILSELQHNFIFEAAFIVPKLLMNTCFNCIFLYHVTLTRLFAPKEIA